MHRKQKAENSEKKKRAPSAYNIFMKSEIPKVKKNNTKLTHKEAFAMAAANWKKE